MIADDRTLIYALHDILLHSSNSRQKSVRNCKVLAREIARNRQDCNMNMAEINATNEVLDEIGN